MDKEKMAFYTRIGANAQDIADGINAADTMYELTGMDFLDNVKAGKIDAPCFHCGCMQDAHSIEDMACPVITPAVQADKNTSVPVTSAITAYGVAYHKYAEVYNRKNKAARNSAIQNMVNAAGDLRTFGLDTDDLTRQWLVATHFANPFGTSVHNALLAAYEWSTDYRALMAAGNAQGAYEAALHTISALADLLKFGLNTVDSMNYWRNIAGTFADSVVSSRPNPAL